MKHERVLKDETPRSESTQTLPGKEQRTSMNSMDANDRTKPKPEDVQWPMCTKTKGKDDATPHIQSEPGSQEAQIKGNWKL